MERPPKADGNDASSSPPIIGALNTTRWSNRAALASGILVPLPKRGKDYELANSSLHQKLCECATDYFSRAVREYQSHALLVGHDQPSIARLADAMIVLPNPTLRAALDG
jgi:hypothetical protein